MGPDLTGANRRDPEYLLVNIVDPNRVVGQAYAAVRIRDRSGRVENGLLARESPGQITLRMEGGKLLDVSRDEIEELKTSELSLMPEGLTSSMTDQSFSDLVSYLMEDLALTEGFVAGPMNANRPLEVGFPVEASSRPLETPGVEWRRFRAGPAGTIDLVPEGQSESCSYVYAEVKSAKSLETALVLDAARSVKVWVNGVPACVERKPVQGRRIAVTLQPGLNRFLFKVANTSRDLSGPSSTGGSWLRARWLDSGLALDLSR